MVQLIILFEHAVGYALFRVKEFEEVGMLLPHIQASMDDLSRFQSIVTLVAFTAFKSSVVALDNLNCLTEGILSDELRNFLDSCVPKSSGANTVVLGISDPKLGGSIHEALGIKCDHTGVVPQITRGIRFHFEKLVKGLTPEAIKTAQLSLAHSYSRAKIKFNVHRVDNMIIQGITLMDQMDKDINTFSMRIREWYSYHFPELVKIVPDNYMYARVAGSIKNRKDISSENLKELQEIVMDNAKTQAILDAANSSMGMDISPIDLMNVEMFCRRIISLVKYRERLTEYLRSKMSCVAPNLACLIGDQLGARLISRAGSLTNLAKLPSSSIQILGAEKALFRALKTRGNTPKYGLLFNTTFIGRAATRDKGRISRFVANKCSIASRLDCFTDVPVTIFGEKLRQQVEDRLKFCETGEIPKKNIDVMKEALEECMVQQQMSEKKKKDKKKKRKLHLENGTENGYVKKHVEEHAEEHAEKYVEERTEETDAPPQKKKKKKSKKHEVEDE